MSFDALPHDAWTTIADVIPKPWPKAAAEHALRWHAAERHVFGRTLPNVRALADAWGWSPSTVFRLLQSGSWADPARPWKWRVEQERNKVGTSVEQAAPYNADYRRNVEQERNKVGTSVALTRDLQEHPTPDTHTPEQAAPATAAAPTHKADRKKAGPPEVQGAFLRCIEEVKQRTINPDRTATDARSLHALWVALGRPDAASFESDFRAVARWARESDDPAAARDIRAEGWNGGVDRKRDVSTLASQERWSFRLDLAKAWGAVVGDSPTGTAGDWTESDAARIVVQRVLEGGDLYHRDARLLWLAKRTISHIGKREAWRGKGGTVEWVAAWRKEWPASVEAWERKQQQDGAANE